MTVIVMLTVIGTVYDVKQHNREKNLIRGHNNKICNGKDSCKSLVIIKYSRTSTMHFYSLD